MYIAILGRQPELGMAELERQVGTANVSWLSREVARTSAPLDVTQLGGAIKAGKLIEDLTARSWSELNKKIIQYYTDKWKPSDHKITLGISVYDYDISPRDVQKLGLHLKSSLRHHDVSLRLVPNEHQFLSSATSHHNKLGLSPQKIELIIVRSRDGVFVVGESTGAQNISALARRDQGRPRRDAFVGMLPPKLATIMINLASGQSPPKLRILDPFCGTGVVLQESLLLDHDAYGTDLSQKMVDYSRENTAWLLEKYRIERNVPIELGDAMDYTWRGQIDAVVCEAYLGQPFSAPPSSKKLHEVRGNCNHIISRFLANIHDQIAPGTPLCIAVPAWIDIHGHYTRLPLINELASLGFERIHLENVDTTRLIYARPDQVVARELLLLTRR